MRSMRWSVLVATGVFTLGGLGGCPMPSERLTNQGGGSLISFGLKTLRGQLTSSTPDEWQVLADRASELSPEVNINLGDEEAQAIVDFIDANNLNSIEAVQETVQRVIDNPDTGGGLVIPDSLRDLIESGIDLGSIIEVEQ